MKSKTHTSLGACSPSPWNSRFLEKFRGQTQLFAPLSLHTVFPFLAFLLHPRPCQARQAPVSSCSLSCLEPGGPAPPFPEPPSGLAVEEKAVSLNRWALTCPSLWPLHLDTAGPGAAQMLQVIGYTELTSSPGTNGTVPWLPAFLSHSRWPS